MNKISLSAAMYKLIKTDNNVISAYDTAGRETKEVANQLSTWGGDTEDDHISDISDKLGVILAEMGEVEESFASSLEDSRLTLKSIRNTEASVQPSRDHKQKLLDGIATMKIKDPTSPKLVEMEQALVRAEAENLVAEAQLTNIQRHALRESYLIHFSAIYERSEKSMILADYGRKILEYLDDTPVVPGDVREPYGHEQAAKQVLLDCEEALQQWRPKPYEAGSSRLGSNLLPEEHFETQSYSYSESAHVSAPLGGGQEERPAPATRSSFEREDGRATGAADETSPALERS